MRNISNPFKNLGHDLPASIVVFLVALPLCLGIALASGAPLFSGILAGIVGGIVIGSISGSQVSVSGPAAGLTTIVASSILELGSYETFLLAVVLAGLFQIVLGFLNAGIIGNFFPASVIKGMLAAIGLILILKQIPHALGYDKDFEGDESFIQPDGENTFSEILNAWQYFSPGAIIVCSVSLILLILWEKPWIKKNKVLTWVPAPLLVVFLAVLLNAAFARFIPEIQIQETHLVSINDTSGFSSFISQLMLPDFSQFGNVKVYTVALTIALVASLETLLSIEAADKLDPFKRNTPLNRELKAQGTGNMISGLVGGLPLTAVIVRSSANINAGARTKLSTIIHGLLLLTSVVTIPFILNLIPLSCLAAILILTGYKLIKPSLVRQMYRKGWSQFAPFAITIIAILFTNLLYGIFIGIAAGLFFVLKTNFHEAISMVSTGQNYLLRLNKDVSFLNKATLRKAFQQIPPNTSVIIDGGSTQFIDADIVEIIDDFVQYAHERNIQVEIKKTPASPNALFRTA